MYLYGYVYTPDHISNDIDIDGRLYRSYDEAIYAASKKYRNFYTEESQEGLVVYFNRNNRSIPLGFVTIIQFELK